MLDFLSEVDPNVLAHETDLATLVARSAQKTK